MRGESLNMTLHACTHSVPDPDLEIEGGEGRLSSRPLDKGGSPLDPPLPTGELTIVLSFCALIGDSGIVRQVQESHSLQEFHDDLSLKRQVMK